MVALQLGHRYIVLIIPATREPETSPFCSWHLVSQVTHEQEPESKHWTFYLMMGERWGSEDRTQKFQGFKITSFLNKRI